MPNTGSDTIWKHLPNFLSALRIIAVPVFAFFYVYYDNTFGARVALGIYFAASITDILDGYIARTYHLESDLGRILDPLADKLLIIAGFICPLFLGVLPWWFVLITFIREGVVIAISVDAIKQKIIPKPSVWGKVKTVFQMSTIVGILIYMAITNDIEWNILWIVESGKITFLSILVTSITWIGLITSLWSMCEYLQQFFEGRKKPKNEQTA